MAAIPTYIYLGDIQTAGAGAALGLANTGLPYVHGLSINYPRFMRVVPSGADGVTGGTFSPYWDGTLSGGSGGFTAFYHTPLGLHNGDNWYLTPPSIGVSPTPLLINGLWDRHPTGFKLVKYGVSGGWGTGAAPLKTGGAGRTAFTTVWSNVVAALGADTPDVKGIILDASYTDLVNNNATYLADLQDVITWVRTAFSASAPIILVNHHRDLLYGGNPGAAIAARTLNQQIATFNDDVLLMDMSFAQIGADYALLGQIPVGPDGIMYRQQDYIEAGARIARLIDAFYTDAPVVAATARGIPTFAFVCDSQGTTVGTDPQYVVLGGSGSLLGNSPGSTERAGEYIWNNLTRTTELYDVLGNTNTLGEGFSVSSFGPEMTALAALKAAYPDGVCVFKYARAGVSLTTEAVTAGATAALEQSATLEFETIRDAFSDFLQTIHRDLGRQADLKRLFISLGGNDTLTEVSAAAFASKLPTFIDDMREVFTTRSDGPELPVVILQPSPPSTTNPLGTAYGNPVAREAVRATIAALPNVRDRVTVLLDTGRELRKGEMIHFASATVEALGYDIAEAFLAFDEGVTEEEVAAEATTDTPSETAAFVVEDGTGLTTANSYVSVAFSDTYHDAQGNPTTWSTATTVEKQDALRRATEELDLRYGVRWNGWRASSEQALDFPRTGLTDSAGNDVDDDVIPTPLKRATARAALLILQGETLLPATMDAAAITSESKTLPGGLSKSVTYQGGKPASTSFPMLDRMLEAANLIGSGDGWGYAEA